MSPASLQACGEGAVESGSAGRDGGLRGRVSVSAAGDAAFRNPDPGPHPLRRALKSLGTQPVGGVFGVPVVPSTLWNSMVAPLTPLAITAFLWYQGESNAGNPVGYARCFPAMITQWRGSWALATSNATAADLPFLFAQLSSWPNNDNGQIPTQRIAQTAALALPRVGMAVAADIGDPSGAFHPIHPPFKALLAQRMWTTAQSVVYNLPGAPPATGPAPVSVYLDVWDASWGDYHYGYGSVNVCGAGSGFLCAGVRVVFDQPLVATAMANLVHGWSWGGFELWDATNAYWSPVTLTGLRADDPTNRTLQLNTTWVWYGTTGAMPPAFLRLGWHDYPNLPLTNAYSLPVAPFNITVPPPAAGSTAAHAAATQ
jgi:hypothetical protein